MLFLKLLKMTRWSSINIILSDTDSRSCTSQNDLMAFGRSFFIVGKPIVMVCIMSWEVGSSLQWFCNCNVVITGSSIFAMVECGVVFGSCINHSDWLITSWFWFLMACAWFKSFCGWIIRGYDLVNCMAGNCIWSLVPLPRAMVYSKTVSKGFFFQRL